MVSISIIIYLLISERPIHIIKYSPVYKNEVFKMQKY